jgi:hypothetical protein
VRGVAVARRDDGDMAQRAISVAPHDTRGRRILRGALRVVRRKLPVFGGRFDRLRVRLRVIELTLDPQTRVDSEYLRDVDYSDPTVPDARDTLERWLEARPTR